MDWDDARYFLAVFRGGSLSQASRELGCSHSTVRRRIETLEKAVGTELFVSASDGLFATDAAREALSLAEALESAALGFQRVLSGKAVSFTGRIIVSTVDVLARSIAPSITMYQQLHPRVELLVLSDNRQVDLSRREADVAIRVGAPTDKSLFGKRIGRLSHAPYAAQSLIDRVGADMATLPWVLWDKASRATLTEEWYAKTSAGDAPLVRVTSSEVMLSLVCAGTAAAILPTSIGRQSGLVQIGAVIEAFHVDVWCLTHFDLRESARIRAFTKCVDQTALFLNDV